MHRRIDSLANESTHRKPTWNRSLVDYIPPQQFAIVCGAIGVLVVLRGLGSTARYAVFVAEHLQTSFPLSSWWALIPAHSLFWLVLAPAIAAIIVGLRTAVYRAALLHLLLLAAAIVPCGTVLNHISRLQGSELYRLLDDSRASRPPVSPSTQATGDASLAVVEDTQSATGSKVKIVELYAVHGTSYWLAITLSEATAYLAVVAAGYAALYFQLASSRALQAERLQSSLLQLRHEALCSRLTPHFLRNTLNMISALTLSDGAKARQCISQLGSLLEASVEAMPDQVVPLQHELDMVRTYFSIQKLRFGPDLECRLEVDEGIDDALVPAFLLQPLVENCFIHGFHDGNDINRVVVRVQSGRGKITLEVADNGVGTKSDGLFAERYGLGITRERLLLQYAGDATLEYRENVPVGLIVLITIPLRHAS